ncbi:MAG: hypothetical protein ACRD2Y_00375, partial [Terriglobales bacterium]
VNAVKEDCRYVVTFEGVTKHKGEDWVLVLVENVFKLRNLTGLADEEFPIKASLTGYTEIGNLPEFVHLKVNEQKIRPTEAKTVEKRSLDYKVKLPAERNTRITVSLAMRLAYPTSYYETFPTSKAPIEDLSVFVENRIPAVVGGFRLEVMHPHFEEIENTSPLSWRFRKVLLPGQGFVLMWQKQSAAEIALPADSVDRNHPKDSTPE